MDISVSSIEKCFIHHKIRKILMSSRRCQLKLVKICLQCDINFYIHRNIQHRCQDTDRLDRVYKKYHSPVNNGWIFQEVLMCYKHKGH